jgi:iron-sulfur cluster assembly protein
MNEQQPQIYDPKQINPEDAITLTDSAVRHIQHTLQKRGAGIGIRLSTKKAGCNGYKYHIDVIEQAQADDHVFDVAPGIQVIVSLHDFPLLKGTQLDYVREGLNAHFVYHNPNQSGSCGCGESFSV